MFSYSNSEWLKYNNKRKEAEERKTKRVQVHAFHSEQNAGQSTLVQLNCTIQLHRAVCGCLSLGVFAGVCVFGCLCAFVCACDCACVFKCV